MHVWGDKGVDWQGINDAAAYIANYLRVYGRIYVLGYKEKWGTVRVSVSFTYTEYYLLNKLIVPYQEWIYRRAYRSALRKWPHLREEILSGADYDELLEGL